MTANKKVIFFTRYAKNGASSRLRFLQYIPFFNKKSVDVEVKEFFSRQYLIKKYNKKRYGLVNTAKLYFQQFKFLLQHRKDAKKTWFIEYELLPFVPYFIEKIFLKNCRYILNFDDNVWEKYNSFPCKLFLNNKYNKLIKNANHTIVANQFLKDKVQKITDNVILIPTAIDVEKYKYHKLGKFSQFTIGWIGTPETYHYITMFADYWQKLATKIDYKLLIIATENLQKYSIDNVNMQFIDWSERIETTLLQQCHVGIMPLAADDFSQGKSAYKIIQYFASGVVPIASNIGENNHIIENEKNGFLVDNNIAEWVSVIENLAKDPQLLQQIQENALLSAQNYDLRLYAEKIYDLID